MDYPYLVLNKAENPNVKTWVVEVNTRTFDQNNQPQDKTLDKISLKNNINYWQVPEKISASGTLRFLEITGLDGSGNTLVSEDPIIISDHPETALESGSTSSFLPGCEWLCNGSYYAWEIKQHVNPDMPLDGPSVLQVETALTFNVGLDEAIPYYRYITPGEYNTSCPNGVGTIGDVSCGEVTGLWLTPPFNVSVSDNNYRNADGVPLHGNNIRGVGKTLGSWVGQNLISTPELSFGMDKCGNDTWWAMGIVNNNRPIPNGYPVDGTGTNYYPILECNDPSPSNGIEASGSSNSCIEGVWQDLLNTPTQSPDDNDSIGDVWTPFVEAIVECLTEEEDDDGSVLSWQERINKITILNLNDVTNPVIEIDPADASTFSDGLNLRPGLYNFGFVVKDIGYVPMIFELDKKLTVNMAMSNLLSVNIYPVPIVDNKFTIDMTASDALNFTYEFRGSNGTLLYSEKFSLKKGQQWKHMVKPRLGVPNGNHFNRFVFQDGSTLSFQTIK